MPSPIYAVHLRPDGTIRVMRSDGDDCTKDTAEWLSALMTRSLREKALATKPEFRGFREKVARVKGTTRRGEVFKVDQLVHELEAERARQGLSRAAVAQALFDDDARLGSYVRGRSRPQPELLRLWAYVLGLTIMTVPRGLEDKIRAMIAEWRGELPPEPPIVTVEVES